MLFRRKGYVRKEFDKKLLYQLEDLQKRWKNEKMFRDQCIDFHDDLDIRVKLKKLKYVFLLKEARKRKIKITSKLY